ncbi:helix-turn-helix domain-containing protein [Streptomyces sp. KR80]|uniref:helix-turn-helix domain-containing protein n=1 Tax=Streptomyces sp. KR80 TaxID=3457426 RepID=UPI003FD3EE08
MSHWGCGMDGFEPTNGAAFFGTEVREWRTRAELTQKELAEKTNYGPSYIAMVETGGRLGSPEFAAGCDEIFDTGTFFARLRRRASRRGHPEWFVPYVKLEEKAETILDYSTSLIPGLLQTEAYAHAVFRAANLRDDDEVIQRKVEVRLHRRGVMEREKPPLLWVVLDESCLRRTVGGRKVMREQMCHLLEEARSPHVVIQALPFTAGAPARTGAYNVLTFDDAPGILYLNTHGVSQVIDSSAIVADWTLAYDRLRADALSPAVSLDLIRRVMEEYAE